MTYGFKLLNYNPVEETFLLEKDSKRYVASLDLKNRIKVYSVESVIRLVFKEVYEYTPLISIIEINKNNIDEISELLKRDIVTLLGRMIILRRDYVGALGEKVLPWDVKLNKEKQQILADLFVLSFIFSMRFSPSNWIITKDDKIIPILNVEDYLFKEYTSVDIKLNEPTPSPWNENKPAWLILRKLMMYTSENLKDFLFEFDDRSMNVIKKKAISLGAKKEHIEDINISSKLKMLRGYIQN